MKQDILTMDKASIMSMVAFIYCWFFPNCNLLAQDLQPWDLRQYTQEFSKKNAQTSRNASLILATWAVGNITSGLILQRNASGPNKAFHQMNAGWNVVNLGLGLAGLIQASQQPKILYPDQLIKKNQRLKATLLLNVGLDCAYMASGWALIERSKWDHDGKDFLLGSGRSLILQGGFLFLFDIFYALSLPHWKFTIYPGFDPVQGFSLSMIRSIN